MKEIAKTKLSASSITTVPKAVRNFLRLDRGDHIIWCVKDEEIVIIKGG